MKINNKITNCKFFVIELKNLAQKISGINLSRKIQEPKTDTASTKTDKLQKYQFYIKSKPGNKKSLLSLFKIFE